MTVSGPGEEGRCLYMLIRRGRCRERSCGRCTLQEMLWIAIGVVGMEGGEEEEMTELGDQEMR